MSTPAALFFKVHSVFAVVVIAASVLAQGLKKITLPQITGYLLTGVLVGPFVLDVIRKPYLADLLWINDAALAVIAFCAGAELYLPDIRKLFTIIMMHVSMITVFTITIVPVAVLAVSQAIPFLKDFSMSCVVPIAFLCGSLMLERSPSGALAMINEMMSQGPITKTLLGVTIVSDVSLLTTFAITSSFAEAACGEGGFNHYTLISILVTLLLCGTVGYLLGKLIIFIMWIPKLPTMVRGCLIFPIGYLVFFSSKHLSVAAEEHTPLSLSLEPILCCVIASTVAGNQTGNRRQFANILHSSAPYIFVPFFTLSGANMDLAAMAKGIPFALVLVISRVFAIFCATYIGGRFIAKESPVHYKFLWMTLLPQAGPLLGLVNEIREYGDWANELAASCIAALIINHIFGLRLFKWALVLVGEAFKQVPKLPGQDHASIHEEEEERTKDRTMEIRIFGINNISLSIASKLAGSDFNVEIVPSRLMDSKTVKSVFDRRKSELEKKHNGKIQLGLCPYFLDQHFVRKVWMDTFGDEEMELDTIDEAMDQNIRQTSLSYQSLEPMLESICPVGCHTLIFTFPFDRFNYMTCRLLSVCRKLSQYKKVIALIRDPLLAPKFAKIGVIPVYSLSTVAEVLAQLAGFDDDTRDVTLGSASSFWTGIIHDMDKQTTCKLRVNDFNGDFASLEDFDLDNFSKLDALGLADAPGEKGLKFNATFEYPTPFAAELQEREASPTNERELALRKSLQGWGSKVFNAPSSLIRRISTTKAEFDAAVVEGDQDVRAQGKTRGGTVVFDEEKVPERPSNSKPSSPRQAPEPHSAAPVPQAEAGGAKADGFEIVDADADAR